VPGAAPEVAAAPEVIGAAPEAPGSPTPADLALAVVESLRLRGRTLATAESLTGGGVGAALTAAPGASAVYVGGIIAYATELKHLLLGVDSEQLARHGAVAASTAVAMAVGVRLRTGADLGVSTTGVAGPAAQEGHPPGTVFVAVSDRAGAVVRELQLTGDRTAVRDATVAAVLTLLSDRVGRVRAGGAQRPSGDDDGSCGC
jgi:nicotinamide-nucleotide amidase